MTLREVAKEAGVSTTAVHRVLRGKRDVSPKTIELVRRVHGNVGYPKDVNEQAQGNDPIFANFKTRCIGLLLVEKPVELLKIPLFAKFLTEIKQALAEYNLLAPLTTRIRYSTRTYE